MRGFARLFLSVNLVSLFLELNEESLSTIKRYCAMFLVMAGIINIIGAWRNGVSRASSQITAIGRLFFFFPLLSFPSSARGALRNTQSNRQDYFFDERTRARRKRAKMGTKAATRGNYFSRERSREMEKFNEPLRICSKPTRFMIKPRSRDRLPFLNAIFSRKRRYMSPPRLNRSLPALAKTLAPATTGGPLDIETMARCHRRTRIRMDESKELSSRTRTNEAIQVVVDCLARAAAAFLISAFFSFCSLQRSNPESLSERLNKIAGS